MAPSSDAENPRLEKKSALRALTCHRIIRIKLTNFMSYENIDLTPGPGLNLVIGPNGSGKSTIVCAIALGLGGDPDLLGRAKHLASFVREESLGRKRPEKAVIEIHLSNPGKAPLIITRTIFANAGAKAKNISEYTWDGETGLSSKDVRDRLKKFNIRIDNMCQFLPQNKVSAFSRLNEKELLKETIRAGLGESFVTKMIDIHKMEEIIANQENTSKHEEDNLKHYKADREILQKSLDEAKQRDALIETCRKLTAKKEYTEFQSLKEIYTQKKAQVKPLKISAHSLKQEVDQAKRARDTYIQRFGDEGWIEDKKKLLDVIKSVDDIPGKITTAQKIFADTVDTDIDECRNQWAEFNKRQEELQAAEFKANEAHYAVLDWEKNHNLDELKQAKQQANRSFITAQGDVDSCSSTRRDSVNFVEKYKREMREIESSISREESLLHSNAHVLKKMKNQSIESVWKQVQDQKQNLRAEVYLPVLSIKPKNKEVACYLERIISENHLTTLICRGDNGDDPQGKSSDASMLRNKIRASVYGVRSKNDQSSVLDQGLMDKIAAAGFLSDYFEAPEEVRMAMVDLARVDKVIVGTRETEDRFFQLSEQEVRRFISWRIIMPTKIILVTGSRYTSHHMIEAKPIFDCNKMPARYLGQTDTSEQITKRIFELREKLKRTKGFYDEALASQKKAEESMKEASAKAVDYKKEEMRIHALIATYRTLRGKEKSYREHASNKASMEDPKPVILNRMSSFQGHCNSLISSSRQLVETLCNISPHLSQYCFRVVQNAARDAKINGYKQNVEHKIAHQKSVEESYHKAVSECQRMKSDLTVMRDAFNQKYAASQEQLHEDFKDFPDSIEDLNASISSIELRVKQIKVDEKAIERHRELTEEIAKAEETLKNRDSKLQAVIEELMSTREDWLSSVKALITQVNKNFEESFKLLQEKGYECAGKVELDALDAESDILQCGVCIRVRFRKGQDLQRLNIHVQSGGERSLTTFMYLLALNEVSEVPFRVVDEINQGMDEDKERISMQRLFDSAISPDTSQYFLITPKLLAGMQYHSNITFHVIFNGLGALPEMDIKRYIAAAPAGKRTRESNADRASKRARG